MTSLSRPKGGMGAGALSISQGEQCDRGTRPLNCTTPQAHEIKSVLRARNVLLQHGLDDPALAHAIYHLRASFALKHGIQAYVCEMIGHKLARLPLRRFRLYATMTGTEDMAVTEGCEDTHLDDYLARYDHRHLPERVELIQGREDDEKVYFL